MTYVIRKEYNAQDSMVYKGEWSTGTTQLYNGVPGGDPWNEEKDATYINFKSDHTFSHYNKAMKLNGEMLKGFVDASGRWAFSSTGIQLPRSLVEPKGDSQWGIFLHKEETLALYLPYPITDSTLPTDWVREIDIIGMRKNLD